MNNNVISRTIYYLGETGVSATLEMLLNGCGFWLEKVDRNQAQTGLAKDCVSLVLYDLRQMTDRDMEWICTLQDIRDNSTKPILAILRKEQALFGILALNNGMDDVLFADDSELVSLARIQAQIRSYERITALSEAKMPLKMNGLEVDDNTRKVSVEGQPVKLTPTEYNILHLLLERPGRVLSNEQIYRSIWKMDPLGADNTVAVHIRHLREKIEENPQDPRYIKVVWGQGYKVG